MRIAAARLTSVESGTRRELDCRLLGVAFLPRRDSCDDAFIGSSLILEISQHVIRDHFCLLSSKHNFLDITSGWC